MADAHEPPKDDEKIAPVAAIAGALKDVRRRVPIAPTAVGVGIGSAALLAALLYAGRRRSQRDDR